MMFGGRSKIAIPYPLTFIVLIVFITGSGCTSLFARSFDKLDQEDVQEIETVCLQTDISIPFDEDGDAAISLKNLFENLGLSVLGLEDPCDLVVILYLSGYKSDPIVKETYSSDGALISRETVYKSASVEGELTISLQGYQTIAHIIDRHTFSNRDFPFMSDVLDKLAIIWGDEIYWKALQRDTGLENNAIDSLIQRGQEGVLLLTEIYLNGDSWQNQYAGDGLSSMGLDALAAVPDLIDLLEVIEEEGYPENIAKAPSSILTGITGEKFGEDAELWKDWWEEQQ